jgi:Putative restriction endonuclease
LNSDASVYVEAADLATYPDVTVICGPVKRHPSLENSMVNPLLIVEVLSPSLKMPRRWFAVAPKKRENNASRRTVISGSPISPASTAAPRVFPQPGGPWKRSFRRGATLKRSKASCARTAARSGPRATSARKPRSGSRYPLRLEACGTPESERLDGANVTISREEFSRGGRKTSGMSKPIKKSAVHPTVNLSWRDHFLRGGWDSSIRGGTAETEKAYRGIAEVAVETLAVAKLASHWNGRLAWNPDDDEFVRVPMRSVDEARAASSAYSHKTQFGIVSKDAELRIALDGNRCLSIEAKVSPPRRIVEQTLAWLKEARGRFPSALVVSPILAVTTQSVPRIRPRRVLAFWPTDALVLIADREQLKTCIAERIPGDEDGAPGKPRYKKGFLKELDRVFAAPLPVGAVRSDRDGVSVLDFSHAGADLDASAAAFETWITSLPLEIRRHANDNAIGDPAVDWSHAATAAPDGSGVTLYDRFGWTAYLADVRKGRSITRPEKLRMLTRVKASGKLPTGQKVKRIMLVVPTRDDAVALGGLVGQGGLDGVVYEDKDKGGSRFLRDPNVLGETRFVPWPE